MDDLLVSMTPFNAEEPEPTGSEDVNTGKGELDGLP